MSKKNKTVKQIKAESKNKQTTTTKKNRREISDCRKKQFTRPHVSANFSFLCQTVFVGTVRSYVRAIGKCQRDKQKSEFKKKDKKRKTR